MSGIEFQHEAQMRDSFDARRALQTKQTGGKRKSLTGSTIAEKSPLFTAFKEITVTAR
jgi:hypothetical protein